MIHSTSLTLTTNNLGAVCLAIYPISASSMLDLLLILFTAYSACLVLSCQCYHQSRCNLYNYKKKALLLMLKVNSF